MERKTLKRLLLSGRRINTKLFEAVVQSHGLTYNGKWDPQHNSLYVNFRQGKELRDALEELEVVVVGKRQKPFYINGSKDSATGRTDFVAHWENALCYLGRISSWQERILRWVSP